MPELGFEYSEENTNVSYDPVPPGWYYARISASELKDIKSGAGRMIVLTWQLIANEAGVGKGIANRTVYDNLCIEHTNDDAVRIARQNIDQIRKATGKLNARSTEELHGIPILIKLKVRPATDQYDAQNEIRGYKAAQQTSQGTAQQASAFAPSPPAAPQPAAQPHPESPAQEAPPWLQSKGA